MGLRKPLLCTVALLAACAAPSTTVARSSKRLTSTGTTQPATMNHTAVTPGGGTGGSGGVAAPFANPTITRTSTSGTNPPTWDLVAPDALQGDTIQLDFTTNGSAPDGTAEESHTLDSFDEAITWSTWTGFAGGVTVKWTQRYGRTVAGTPLWSNWSNVLSDVLSAPVFTPASVSGIKDYYKVSAAKLFTDTGCTVAVVADGDAVACWQSEMGVLSGFTQATLANRPLYRTNSGHPYLAFDGVNDYLSLGSTTNFTSFPQPFYAIAAVKLTALAGSQIVFDGTQSGQRANLSQNNIGSPDYEWEIGAGTFVGAQGLTPTTNDVVIGGLFNGASSKGRIDQTDGSTISIGSGTFAGSGGGIRLGSQWDLTSPLGGRIYGFVLVGASPSTGDKTSISTWLAALQGRTI